MSWKDCTTFEAIPFQFGIPEKEVIKLMHVNLMESSFKRWRKHINSGETLKVVQPRHYSF